MKTLLTSVAVVVLGLVLCAHFSPVQSERYEDIGSKPISPVIYSAELKARVEIIVEKNVNGPETVFPSQNGDLFAGNGDGRVIWQKKGEIPKLLAHTGGRPLGITQANPNLIYIADGERGLLSVNLPDGKIRTHAQKIGTRFIRFADGIDTSRSGKIYFTEASDHFKYNEYIRDLLESKPHGHAFSFDPSSGKVKELLSNLYFANGIAVSKDEDYVLINESYRYRVRKLWLSGPKAGQNEIFLDQLPGFPDGISLAPNGHYWIALFTIKNRAIDFLHLYPLFKDLIGAMPALLWPKPEPYGFVIEVSSAGKILRSFQDPGGKTLIQTSSAIEGNDGYLYFGSLSDNKIKRLKVR